MNYLANNVISWNELLANNVINWSITRMNYLVVLQFKFEYNTTYKVSQFKILSLDNSIRLSSLMYTFLRKHSSFKTQELRFASYK